MWTMTSRDGQQLVAIAIASPATIRTTGDLAAAVRAGCVPVALCPPACRAWPLGVGPSVYDHAGGIWHVNVAGHRSRPADPESEVAPSARLALLAGPGRGRHPRGRRTSRQRPSLPALAWLPGQRWRPPRRPAAAFVSPAPPPTTCCRAVTGPESPIDVSGGATPGSPARRPQEGSHPMAAPSSSSLASSRLMCRREANQQRQQAISIASSTAAAQGKQKTIRSAASPPTRAGPKRSSLHGVTATGNHNSLGERLDRPPVTHRLDDQAAPTPAGHPQAAPSPDPKTLHRNLVEGPGAGQLEVAPAVGGEVPAVKRPDNPPAPGRRKQLAHRGVASSPLPQDTRLRVRRGRRRQDDRWGGVRGPDLRGLRPYYRRRRWLAWPLGCWWPQVQPPPPPTPPPPAGWRPGTGPRSGGTTVAWAVAPRRSLPCSLRALPPSCPQAAPTREPGDTASMAGSSACCSVAPR